MQTMWVSPLMEWDKEVFKKMFPSLAKELEGGEGIRITVGRRDPLRGFNPTVIDFIRRCKSIEEALEIIDFMEGRGEISSEYSRKLKEQLKNKGLRSFGPYKKPGYYFEYAGLK